MRQGPIIRRVFLLCSLEWEIATNNVHKTRSSEIPSQVELRKFHYFIFYVRITCTCSLLFPGQRRYALILEDGRYRRSTLPPRNSWFPADQPILPGVGPQRFAQTTERRKEIPKVVIVQVPETLSAPIRPKTVAAAAFFVLICWITYAHDGILAFSYVPLQLAIN